MNSYYETNREKLLNYQKIYYQNNKLNIKPSVKKINYHKKNKYGIIEQLNNFNVKIEVEKFMIEF